MSFSIYELVYILGNILMIYTIYKFMRLFYKNRKTSRKVELLFYLIYFIAISILYLYVSIPIVHIIANLIMLFIITMNYTSSLKSRVLSSVLIYLTLMCIETIVVLLTNKFKTNILIENNYKLILGIILSRIISYLVVIKLSSYITIKKNESIAGVYILCTIIIPIGTLFLLMTIFMRHNISDLLLFLCTVFVLVINFGTFYLYEKISHASIQEIDNNLIWQQNKYYEKQLELMRVSLKTTRTIIHDLKNHITCLYILVEDNSKEKTLAYLSQMTEILDKKEALVCTGNVVVDSIINFKLQEAEEDNIDVNINIDIPKDLLIQSFDITVILGNLLDNALVAVKKIKENRYINIEMRYEENKLILNIENSYNGIIIEENGKIKTSHSNKENHGIGIESVTSVLKKYKGKINFNYDNEKFIVELVMPI